MLLVWLLTAARSGAPQAMQALCAAARWATVVLVGLALGWRLSDPQFDQWALRARHAAVLVVGLEAPLTLLVYLHLAGIARQQGARRLGRGMAALGAAATALIAAPPVLAYLLRGLKWREYDSYLAQSLVGAYVAVALAVGMLAAAALVRLAVLLVVKQVRALEQPAAGPPEFLAVR